MGLILASGSVIRARILADAGVPFRIVKPDVDEAAIKRVCAARGDDLPTTARALAAAKALAVASPGDLVLGADQILEFEGRSYDKPVDRCDARARLIESQGKQHTLLNAVAIARAGAVVFEHLDRPALYVRPLTIKEIDRYLDAAGEDILSSVGGYQVERFGSRLFERIEGDYFAVLGLSLFPVLRFLRAEGHLSF